MATATEHVLVVRATWDDDAKVWVAESDDVPGLATEASSLDALMTKLQGLIPELLELNNSELAAEIPFELLARPSPGSRAPRS
jgi:predicted RNase H-like HicB family nuclease